MKKKIIGIILIIIVAIIIIIGYVLAVFTDTTNTDSTINVGSVSIEPINLQVQIDQLGTMGKTGAEMEPGDVNLITWQVKNTGKSAIYTRHTLRIYWNEEIDYTNNDEISLYPANLTKAQITEDLNNEKQYKINKEENKIIVNKNNEQKLGVEYKFYGDILDGEDAIGYSQEKDYNNSDFEKTTDDTSTKEDIVAFKIIMNPEMSYLFQDKTISIEVITEAMQYNINGESIWQVVDTQTI